MGTTLAHAPLQTDPEIWAWRAINPDIPEVEGQTTTYAAIDDHGLGAAWRGLEIGRTYDGGGTLTMRVFTDSTPAGNAGDPLTAHPGHPDTTYPHLITLEDSPAIVAGWDGYWRLVTEGLRGAVDGVPGTFSCAAGSNGYCGIEAYVTTGGFYPDTGADPLIFTPDDGSGDVMLPHPTPVEVGSENYLAMGSWLFVPEDITDLDAYDFGVFSSGDDPFAVDNLQALTGTADYAGEAAGTYSDRSQETLDSFEAKVELTADFGSAQEFGSIVGRVYDFAIDGGKSSPLSELNLNTAPWRSADENILASHEGGPPFPGGWVDGNSFAETDTAIWVGSWGGKFFGNGAASSDLPSAFGGTFGATDGSRTYAGSFGARQQ